MIEPRIAKREATTLVGMCHRAGTGQGTVALWRRFMPRRGEIVGRVGEDLVSMRVFHDGAEPLTMRTPFDEWAAVEADEESRGAVPLGARTGQVNSSVIPSDTMATQVRAVSRRRPSTMAPRASRRRRGARERSGSREVVS